MDGQVTISIQDFEMFRRYEKAVKEAYKELNKCKFVGFCIDDNQKAVNADPVIEALRILSSI